MTQDATKEASKTTGHYPLINRLLEAATRLRVSGDRGAAADHLNRASHLTGSALASTASVYNARIRQKNAAYRLSIVNR